MANIAVQRIKREFKEVLKSEEVRAARRRAPPPPSPAARWECGSGERSGRPPARGGPRCPSAPPPRAGGGWDRPAASGRGMAILEEKGPTGKGREGGGGDLPLREPGERGRPAAGRAESPPVAGRRAASRAGGARPGLLPRPSAPPPAPRVPPSAQPSAFVLRAGLPRAGGDGGGWGFRRLQHRLRLAPLLHKPGFLIS